MAVTSLAGRRVAVYAAVGPASYFLISQLQLESRAGEAPAHGVRPASTCGYSRNGCGTGQLMLRV